MRARGALALAALVLAGCSPPPVPAHPALWRVQDRDTTIWLFGSIHALPPGVAWQTPAVARALAEADTLILEIAPADAAAAHAEFTALATAPGLPPLAARVAAADRATLARAVAGSGQSPERLDRYKTWAAALAIAAGTGNARGVTAADGVEAVVAARFRGKAIGALETQAGQLALFDRLPEAAQRALLAQAVADVGRTDAGSFTAWANGDEAAIAATLAPLHRQPALEQALVTMRNARWATAIARRMARPGRVLIVVGAGHLAGPGSVVALLRARGLQVARVG